MCKFSSKSGGVPFQPLGDLTWNDPCVKFFKVGPFQSLCVQMLKIGPFYRGNFLKYCNPPLSNLGYPSATPLNFAEFGAPAPYPRFQGHSMSNHPIPYTAPTQIFMKLHTYGPCDPNRRNPFFLI